MAERDIEDRWTGKPRPAWTMDSRTYEDDEPCPYCGGTTVIMDCPKCGAPNCCIGCCFEAEPA
jgi:hypothetical protein